jgi:hypothetical protein
MMIARVWRKHSLKPQRLEGYMASDDPDFETKAADIIALYLHPRQHAAVFCVKAHELHPQLQQGAQDREVEILRPYTTHYFHISRYSPLVVVRVLESARAPGSTSKRIAGPLYGVPAHRRSTLLRWSACSGLSHSDTCLVQAATHHLHICRGVTMSGGDLSVTEPRLDRQ